MKRKIYLFKGMMQWFKVAFKVKDLRQPEFSVRRLHGTLIMCYSTHVGRTFLR